jgi:hypothetical protein
MQKARDIPLARRDLRQDRRHALPVLEVTIGDERFSSINWSMQGALLDGMCEFIGTRVRGVMGIAGSCEAIPFAATVIRADPETGSCAICFESCRTEQIEFWPHHQVGKLQ